MFLIWHPVVTLPKFSGGLSVSRSDSENSWDQHHYVQQIRVKLDMKAPALWHHSRLGILFVETYKKELRYQMTVNLVGTDRFCLEGRVRFNKECKLRNARKRFKREIYVFSQKIPTFFQRIPTVSKTIFSPKYLRFFPNASVFSKTPPFSPKILSRLSVPNRDCGERVHSL